MSARKLNLILFAIVAVIATSGLALSDSLRGFWDRDYSVALNTLAPATVTITTTDYAFTMPDTITAGVTELALVNRGKEPHHAWIIRLDSAKTLKDVFAALQAGGPPPKWAVDVGGPNAGAPNSTAFLDLKPGRYAVVCFIPSPDGKPHIMKGMAKEVIVTPRRGAAAAREASASMPRPTTTMTLVDYGYQLTKPITAGRQVIRVVNGAAQPHEVFIGRLLPGKTAQDFLAWERNPQGPPPLVPMGGTTGMAKGEENTIVIDFEPGEYALYCFVPDARDGKPHVAHGMVTQLSVK